MTTTLVMCGETTIPSPSTKSPDSILKLAEEFKECVIKPGVWTQKTRYPGESCLCTKTRIHKYTRQRRERDKRWERQRRAS